MRKWLIHCFALFALLGGFAPSAPGADNILVPQIDGGFWQVAGDPDLGKYTSPNQQPVDFGIWQAADGTWQLWSCIRSTLTPGKTRLFYRWQADKLTDSNWTPMGIAMMADPNFGETEGGLQAPFVLKEGSDYYMFYGDWEHVAMAKSEDGKTFARQLTPDGKSGMFGERPARRRPGNGVRLAPPPVGYGPRDQPGRDHHLGRDERRPRGGRSKRRDTPENWYGVARQQIAPGPVMSVA